MSDKKHWSKRWAYRQFQTCTQCDLWKYRHQVVVGRGSLPADVVIIGEGPGMSEDVLGKAFIGVSGKLLDVMLAEALLTQTVVGRWLQRDLEFFFTNTILCRPCNSKDGANRQPWKGEIDACRDNVLRIIRSAQPRYIVYAGDVAARTMRRYFKDVPTVKIYHPAHVARQGGRGTTRYQHNVRILSDMIEELYKKEV